MPREREKVVRAIDLLMEEARALRKTLSAAEAHYRKTRALLVERRSPLEEALSSVPTQKARQDLTDGIARLEEARRRVRRASIVLGQKEGLSLGELARLWGFSRQLAARYAKEAAAER
jgi:hypothetical protein